MKKEIQVLFSADSEYFIHVANKTNELISKLDWYSLELSITEPNREESSEVNLINEYQVSFVNQSALCKSFEKILNFIDNNINKINYVKSIKADIEETGHTIAELDDLSKDIRYQQTALKKQSKKKKKLTNLLNHKEEFILQIKNESPVELKLIGESALSISLKRVIKEILSQSAIIQVQTTNKCLEAKIIKRKKKKLLATGAIAISILTSVTAGLIYKQRQKEKMIEQTLSSSFFKNFITKKGHKNSKN